MVRPQCLVVDGLTRERRSMAMISYAQNAEDVLLNRLFSADHAGFYVDIGANHPTLHSVTRHFYDRGWRGVNVEPSPLVHALLEGERPRDRNLNVGISACAGSLTFFESVDSLGMSTFDPGFAAGLIHNGYAVVESTVPVVTLADLLDEHAVGQVDFLKIDVESHEDAVIRGGDWSRHRPRVVVVESTSGYAWESVLLNADYLYAAFDGLNRYYVRSEDRAWLCLLEGPAGYLDQFVTHEHARELNQARERRDILEIRLAEEIKRVEWLERVVKLERVRTAEAREQLLPFQGLGSNSLALARRVHRVSSRFPRLAGVVKNFCRVGSR